jgi:uncharacterized alkaline shock family protein YloU
VRHESVNDFHRRKNGRVETMSNLASTETNTVAPSRRGTGDTHRAERAAQEEENASVLESEDGRTIIQNEVVAKIAGMAIREVEGVHSLAPFGAGQAFGRFTRRVTGKQMRDLGVHVEMGKVEVAVDTRIIVTYGYSIIDTAREIRESVKERLVQMTGLKVVEINIEVVDLNFPSESQQEEEKPEPRVH